MNTTIDFRSDTVTQPTAPMRQAMAGAKVGDDVYGDDPCVNELEQKAAELLGQEAGLFVTSGTQGNLLAILTHCQRGEEYIAGMRSHAYLEEAGGGAVLASVQPQPIENQPDGTLDLEAVQAAIKPDDFHLAITKLLCLENTFLGTPLTEVYLQNACSLARQNGLNLHLDGARLFNAAIKTGVSAKEIAGPFDSVSACLSKGLGSPIGSILAGSAQFISKARRWRKMLGGATRQAGILAAAGIYALDHHIDRLAVDHELAQMLADGLEEIQEINVQPAILRTNMVFISVPSRTIGHLSGFMKEHGIILTVESNPIRLVTHLNIDEKAITKTINQFKEFFLQRQAA
ncbi:low-specificity L-threonine aldolase [Arenicellales bacterium nBUS_48]